MRIEPAKKKVSELFPIQGAIRYDIPCFQRPYSWSEEQICQLLEDVCTEDSGYYAGNILVICDGDDFSVIDGQQRLTTISLFLLALSDLFRQYSDVELAIENKGFIKRQLFSDGMYTCPRINLLEKDAEIYSDLLRISLGEELKGKWGNRRLYQRFQYVRNTLSEEFQSFSSMNDFYQKLMEVTLLRIDVPDVTDAFMVFSSLNSKGQPLTLVDLLKGEFIGKAASAGHTEKVVLDNWNELSAILSFGEDELSERFATQFLLNNLDAFENEAGNSATKSKALSRYQSILNEKYAAGVDYLDVLVRRSKVFARIVRPDLCEEVDPEELSSLERLGKLESTQAIPLLMFFIQEMSELGLEQEHIYQILNALIDFYVRRNIVLTPKSSNIRAKFLALIRQIRKEGARGREIVDGVINVLEELSASDEQFKAALNQPVYDKNAATARFVLIDIERRLGGSPIFDKAHPDTLDEYITSRKGKKKHPRWSIEHILPEGNLPECWVNDLADGDAAQAKKTQDEYVHLFGNLTLTPYNPELSQKPFYSEEAANKRDYKDKQNGKYVGLRIGLYLNESIPDGGAGETIDSKRQWGPRDIRRRNDWFVETTLKLYPLPSKGAQN